MATGRYGEGNGRQQGSIDSMEKPKVVTRRFDSTPSRRGRVTIGNEQRNDAPVGRQRLGAKAGGRRR
jgi:hypothetical protein